MSEVPTASQTVGPFFSIGLAPLCRSEIAAPDTKARRVTVRGRIVDGDGVAVPDAMLEIWNAGLLSGAGTEKYPSAWGRIATNESGEFEFTASKPIELRESNTTLHAPHIVVLIFMRGLLRHLVTRIYFPDEPANSADPALQAVPTERRGTIIARRASADAAMLIWNVHLQGEQETVFFDA